MPDETASAAVGTSRLLFVTATEGDSVTALGEATAAETTIDLIISFDVLTVAIDEIVMSYVVQLVAVIDS